MDQESGSMLTDTRTLGTYLQQLLQLELLQQEVEDGSLEEVEGAQKDRRIGCLPNVAHAHVLGLTYLTCFSPLVPQVRRKKCVVEGGRGLLLG